MPSRGLYYGIDTEFHLIEGKEYPVLGISLFKAGLDVLVCDETEKPNWLPIGLFDVPIQRLPADWEFVLLDARAASGVGSADGRMARWGYRDLIRDPNHIDQMIERDPAALEIFFKELNARTNQAR